MQTILDLVLVFMPSNDAIRKYAWHQQPGFNVLLPYAATMEVTKLLI